MTVGTALMWYTIKNQFVELRIAAKPNAKKTALLSVNDQELQISLKARPQNGEANKELISYLSKLLHLPKSNINLQRGDSSRHKKILVPLTNTIQHFMDDPISFMGRQ